MKLLTHDSESRRAVFKTSVALIIAGRCQDAHCLLKQLPGVGEIDAHEAYQMACLESRLGDFEAALHCLDPVLLRVESYRAKALIDSDLQPLWHSFENRQPRLAQAHILLRPVFDDIREWIGTRKDDPELDGNDLKQFPEAWRRLFRFNSSSGTHSIHHLTAARDPEARDACLEWCHSRIENSLHRIERARASATNVVLQAQPAYAALHLTAGNYLGARYHLLWALGKDPAALDDFRANRKLWPMTYFLDELAVMQDADCESSRLLIEASLPNPRINVADLLNDLPAKLHDSSLYLLRAGMALQNVNDYAAALAIWLKLCARWPHDPVGFGNGATCLMHLGLWDRASTLLSHAPEAYRHFHLHEVQCRQLEAQDVEGASAPRTQPFRGQPDLGGLLRSGIPMLESCTSTLGEQQQSLL